ncbi:MAG: antibiotic biosynthesis monooxygenase [Tabrizicola sp.]|nr:antibiotic biosynthesis monooxygenase [Tabrizicola sp.]
MIVEYLRYSIPQDRQAAFVRDYDAALAELMKSPYALGFDLCQCVEDKAEFIPRIEWSSAEDYLQGFRKGPEFRAFFAHIQPYLPMIGEMRHYDRLSRSGP